MRFIAAAPRTDLFTGKYFLYISGFLNGSFILYIEDRNESRKPFFFSRGAFARNACTPLLRSFRRNSPFAEGYMLLKVEYVVKSNLIFVIKEKVCRIFLSQHQVTIVRIETFSARAFSKYYHILKITCLCNKLQKNKFRT